MGKVRNLYLLFYKKADIPLMLLIVIVVLLSIMIIFIESLKVPTEKVADGLTAIISAFIGIVITVVVTAMLLKKQSDAERSKEVSLIQFKHKQDIYLSFLKHLNEIFVSLTDRSIKGNDRTAYGNIGKAEDLLFAFGYLRIHMDVDTFKEVMKQVTDILSVYRSIQLYDTYQEEIVVPKKRASEKVNGKLYELLKSISEHLYSISGILNNDLYNNSIIPRNKAADLSEETNELLNKCGLNQYKEDNQGFLNKK